jgi:hypothetical protein
MAKSRRRLTVINRNRRQRGGPPSARGMRKSPQPRPDALVTIRTLTDEGLIEQPVRRRAEIERLAEEWTYILRSRTRWLDDDELRESFRERALEALEQIGVPRAFMKKLAPSGHVEVELHGWEAANADAARLHEAAAHAPWEYLISAGTRGVGRYHPQLVTRLFRNEAPAVIAPPPQHVLFIESAPGRLEGAYDFASERERIRAAVGADQRSSRTEDGPRPVMDVSVTENLRQLRARVRERKWDVLHVTGIDTHQAAWLVDGFYEDMSENLVSWSHVADASGRICDGMVLRDVNVAELPVKADALAKILINPKAPPSLVTLNLYYSGARTARELVAHGAHAAMGFLDEIDDELAERFFQGFYWAWCRPGSTCTIPQAFVEAWENMKGDRLHGTAIVIWFGRSVFEEFRLLPRPIEGGAAASTTRQDVLSKLAATPMRELLQVDVKAPSEINYSLLHNDRPLFEKLTLTKLVKEPLEDVRVEVELNLGALNYPYRCTHMVFDQPQLPVAPAVRIPLTAALPRSLRERVQSTVYVKVSCAGRTAHESTSRVTLIPVDEWVDDTANNPWLPSFVLPRDPAILKIIASSRRYLVGIMDDPAAGFDGYQSVDDEADIPTAGVDAQVQAIWTALVNEYRLQYINPPPAYSERSQRLRTPTDILASASGTCIDLALLLASCLEYIDVYPVLVLLTGHAFVGYWRSEQPHAAFTKVLHVPAEVPAAGSPLARTAAVRFVDQYGWRLTSLHYNEIMNYVTSGDLVMLEATYLTSASSFAQAMEEGRANMRSRHEFDSLLDIRLARSAAPPVTPLPIIND